MTFEELKSQYDQLKKSDDELKESFVELQKENESLKEQVQILKNKIYGRSKESEKPSKKVVNVVPNQKKSEKRERNSKSRKASVKPKGYKQNLLDSFEQIYVDKFLHDDEKYCSLCNSELKHIGTSNIKRELVFIPGHFVCRNTKTHAYKCNSCSESELKDRIVKSKHNTLIANSIVSPELAVELISQLYILKTPAYRLEEMYRIRGVNISRKNIYNWIYNLAEKYLLDIYFNLYEQLLKQDIIHMDETTIKVLESDKENTYYWLIKSSDSSNEQIVIYDHYQSRGNDSINMILNHFEGHYIQCDMYSGYKSYKNNNLNIELSACFSHMRRYFFDAINGHDLAKNIVDIIDELFSIERSLSELTADKRHKQRQKNFKSTLNKLFREIEFLKFPGSPRNQLDKAVNYALNNKDYFYTILSDGRLVLSNNSAERSVKDIVIRRKNILFHQSCRGAFLSGVYQTLIETAKRNGLDPVNYIQYLLEYLPHQTDEMNIEAYLPWADIPQEFCKTNYKSIENAS